MLIKRYALAISLVGIAALASGWLTGDWRAILMALPLLGQIPSTLTDDYGILLTTTLRTMEPEIHDNITRSNKYLNWLDMKGRWRTQDGGERVKVALMHAQNSTADIYSGYGNLDTTPQDGITSAFFPWSQIAVSISVSRLEERQNSGRSQAIDLLETKTMQAEASLKQLLNNCLVSGKITSGASATTGRFSERTGRLDSGALGPLPLPAIIDATNTRSVSIGNINGSTYSFWRNQATSTSATTFMGMKADMNTVYNNCSKGVGGPPDLMVGDQTAWQQYFNGLHNIERYVVTDPRVIDVLGGAQEDQIRFRNAVFYWDEVVPDVQTNADVVDAIGTISKSTIYFIVSEAVEWITDSQTDFITTPFVRPVGQDARVAQVLWMGAHGVNNRRKLGVLYNLNQTITS